MASGTIKNLGFNNTYVKLGSILINNQTTELTISLSDSYKNYKFIYIVISYYDSGYPAYGCVLIPSSLGPLYGSESLRFYDIEHNSEIKINFKSNTVMSVLSTNYSATAHYHCCVFGIN